MSKRPIVETDRDAQILKMAEDRGVWATPGRSKTGHHRVWFMTSPFSPGERRRFMITGLTSRQAEIFLTGNDLLDWTAESANWFADWLRERREQLDEPA